MDNTLIFITNGSNEFYFTYCMIRDMLSDVCEVKSVSIREAASAEIPQAILMPYKKEYAYDPDFHRLASRITERFGQEGAEDLRTYILPFRLSEEEFMSIMDSGSDPALEELGDVIQITPYEDLGKLAGEIKHYFLTREKNKKRRKKEETKHKLQYLIGSAATALTVICLISSALYPIYLLNPGGYFTFLGSAFSLIPYDSVIACLVWFISWIMMFSVILEFSRRGLAGLRNEWDRIVSYPVDSFLFLFLLYNAGLQVVVLYQKLDGRWYLIPAGIVFGWIVDMLRRMRLEGTRYRRFKALDKEMSTGTDRKKLSDKLRNSGRRPVTNALRKTFFHKGGIKIFVSYTHSSAWARERVDEMLKLCREEKIECFVDKEGIPRGASWRRNIFTGLLRADYFVAFVDDVSVTKQWPAAELEMALAVRSVSNTIYPVVIVPPDFQHRVKEEYMPVFRDTMLCSSEPDFFVRVIWYSKAAVEVLIRKAFAKYEMKSPDTLFPVNYPGKKDDKARAKEANNVCAIMEQARRTETAYCYRQYGKKHSEIVDDRYHLIQETEDADNRKMYAEFMNNANYANDRLMPQQAYMIIREAVELATLSGEPHDMIRYGKMLIADLYGSLYSDYELYLEIHRYEYMVAFAYEQIGDIKNAVIYARRCLRGVESINTLISYYQSGFTIDNNKKKTIFSTVLPLSFKFFSDNTFGDFRPQAEALLKRHGKTLY